MLALGGECMAEAHPSGAVGGLHLGGLVEVGARLLVVLDGEIVAGDGVPADRLVWRGVDQLVGSEEELVLQPQLHHGRDVHDGGGRLVVGVARQQPPRHFVGLAVAAVEVEQLRLCSLEVSAVVEGEARARGRQVRLAALLVLGQPRAVQLPHRLLLCRKRQALHQAPLILAADEVLVGEGFVGLITEGIELQGQHPLLPRLAALVQLAVRLRPQHAQRTPQL
mmetsp:Transcript_11316/g.45978  ORF Transcript_11316/g.45978 Transcript_11316/m.45978 type:complete len:223 (-) Transcript_11316:318-986(-)